MAYAKHFQLTDDLMAHLDAVLGAIPDRAIQARYTGFLAISSAAVIELSIKTMFEEFAEGKHKVFGHYVGQSFQKINGRIKLADIKDDYLQKCGVKYKTRFTKRLDLLERKALVVEKLSIKTSYSNMLVCRHQFAHTGQVPSNTTYAEVKQGYECGKKIMHCLAGCLTR